MKRWLGIITLCMLLVGAVSSPAFGAPGGKNGKIPPGQAKKLLFSDMMETPWAAETIEKMADLGIINGYPGNKVLPNKPVTQLEALIMAMRIFDWPEGDVDHWLATAKSNGVPSWAWQSVAEAIYFDVLPADLKRFQPNKPVTRVQVAEIIVNTLDGAENEKLVNLLEAFIDGENVWFNDEKDIPERYRDKVRFLARLGIMKGYPDCSFKPNKPVTRAEMATLLANLRKLELDEKDSKETEVVGYIVYKDIDEDTSTIYVKTGKKIIKVELDELDEVSRRGRTLTEKQWDNLKLGDKVVLEKADGVEKLSALYFGGEIELIVYIDDIDTEENLLEVETVEGFEFTYPVDEDVELSDFEKIIGKNIKVRITLQKGEVVALSFLTD